MKKILELMLIFIAFSFVIGCLPENYRYVEIPVSGNVYSKTQATISPQYPSCQCTCGGYEVLPDGEMGPPNPYFQTCTIITQYQGPAPWPPISTPTQTCNSMNGLPCSCAAYGQGTLSNCAYVTAV